MATLIQFSAGKQVRMPAMVRDTSETTTKTSDPETVRAFFDKHLG